MRPPPPLEGPLQQPIEPAYCTPPPPPLIQQSTHEQHRPKILHSLLHNYNHMNVSSHSSHSSHSYSSSSSYGNMLSPMGPTPRARSGSLGSTGSSIRDSCSPGHESSTSSHETLSRGSPMSIGSSPSPSPPVTDSKLLGILRGSVAPQYAHLLLDSPRSLTSPTLSEEGAASLKREHDEQDEPMDLSCKRKKQKTVVSSRSASSTTNSILEAVLCGKTHPVSNHQNWFCDNLMNYQQSERASILADTSYLGGGVSSRSLSVNQRVGLAKKTIPPVQARVQDWLVKIVQLAKLQPEFVRLPHSDKVILIVNAWPRVLLLHMAENNFQFVVTPVHLRNGMNNHNNNTSTNNNDSSSSSSHTTTPPPPSSAVPTMSHVEAIQNMISKCQAMNLDQKEYQYIRKSALFHSGYDGLENAEYVDDVNTYIRDDLQVHIRNSRPNEKLRYSNILLCLHTLFGINTGVVDSLFCIPRASGLQTNQMLKELLHET